MVADLDSALFDAESLEDVVSNLRDSIREAASEGLSCDPDYDGYEYSDFETRDGEGRDVDYNDDRLIERIRDYLLNNNPDRLRELEGE
jgi:hypothetical protein